MASVSLAQFILESGYGKSELAQNANNIFGIKKNDKACFTVYDEGYIKPGEWALNINSVVIFGRISLVEDYEKAREICTNLVKKFTDDEEFLENEMKNALPRVQCLQLIPEHITGKLVNES